MNEKRRGDFEMTTWTNPAVMTENQIYETCGELENHYCTPVPSRQTSTVLNPVPLASTSSKYSFAHGSRKCATVSLLFLILFALFFVAIGCCGYAIFELQRLQSEVSSLREEISDLRASHVSDVRNLNASILEEARSRQATLLELESRSKESLGELSNTVATNFSRLTSDVSIAFSFLGEDVRTNLSVLSNVSLINLMELADDVWGNFTAVLNVIRELDNQTEGSILQLQDTIDSEISSLDARTSQSLQALANWTEVRVDGLNSTINNEITRVTSQLLSLGNMTSANITQLTARQKTDFEMLVSLHQSDTSRLESLIITQIDTLTTNFDQRSTQLETSVTSLRDEASENLTSLENVTRNSIFLLNDEVGRVEMELALEAHGSISQLNMDLRQNLNELSVSFSATLSDLEMQTKTNFSAISDRTFDSINTLQSEFQANLTQLRLSTTQNFEILVNQTQIQFNLLETTFQYGLGNLSVTTVQDLSKLSMNTELSIMNLNSSIMETRQEQVMADSVLQDKIDQFREQVEQNFTDTRQHFNQNIAQLMDDLNSNIEDLNSSDENILNRIDFLDERLGSTNERLNTSVEILQTLIAGKDDRLRTSLATVQADIEQLVKENVSSLYSSIQELSTTFDATSATLKADIEEVSLESFGNFTVLRHLISTLELQVDEYAEETRTNLSKLAMDTDEALDDVIANSITNLTQLQTDVFQALNTTNASLAQDIWNVFVFVNNSVTELAEVFLSDINETNTLLSQFVMELTYQLNALNSTLISTINTNEENFYQLQIILSSTTLLISSLQENTSLLIEQNMNITESLISTAIKTLGSRIDLTQTAIDFLEEQAHWNITELEYSLLRMLRNLQNDTQTEIELVRMEVEEEVEDLRLAIQANVTRLSDNISRVTEDLQEASDYANASLANLEASLMQNKNGLTQLAFQVEGSFTTLRETASYLNSNITVLTEMAESTALELNSTNLDVNSLQSDLRDLVLEVGLTQGNVSSVSSQLELLEDSLQTHLNSSVDLYQGCIEHRETCMFNPGFNDYYRECITDPLPINITVSFA